MLEKITHEGLLLGIIIRKSFYKEGVSFVTPSELSQQVAFMHHSPGKVIDAHFHNPVRREVHITQEVLFIKKGKLRVDFYDRCQNYINSRILDGGDTILLASGGHGFEVLEELEMIEVKQGPYSGDADKTRFKGVLTPEITIVTKDER